MSDNFPNFKKYYSITEVADMLDINASVIRYWNREFKQLNPIKNAKGDRRFTEKDIAVVKKIYILLKEKGFTIEGAKKELLNEGSLFENTSSPDIDRREVISKLDKIKDKLQKLKSGLG